MDKKTLKVSITGFDGEEYTDEIRSILTPPSSSKVLEYMLESILYRTRKAIYHEAEKLYGTSLLTGARSLKIGITDFDGKEYELTSNFSKEEIEKGLAAVHLHFMLESATRNILSLPLCDSWKGKTPV